MKVLLVAANTETVNMPALPLGPACVAAALRGAGHDVLLLNLMFLGDAQSAVRSAIADLSPDVIAISVRNIDDQNMAKPRLLLPPVRAIVAACRAASPAPIVLGGAGYSIFPESALGYLGADMGIQGEGEAAFPELLARMSDGEDISEVPGICLPGCRPRRRRYVSRLDDLPLPDPALWIPPATEQPGLWIPVQTRRGCPMDCSFCSTSMIEGRSIRRHSPGRIVNWLASLRETGHRNFSFVDNTFNLPPSYAKELCRRIAEARLDLNLWCIVYPKWIDRELVDLMRAAGCAQVSLGFESGSEPVLRTLNKRFGKQEVAAVSKMFADAGIGRAGFLMLGGPGETRDTVEESLAFADSLTLNFLKVTTGLRIYPGTALARTALAEGLLGPGQDLLFPRFYLAPALQDWLPERIAAYRAARPSVN